MVKLEQPHRWGELKSALSMSLKVYVYSNTRGVRLGTIWSEIIGDKTPNPDDKVWVAGVDNWAEGVIDGRHTLKEAQRLVANGVEEVEERRRQKLRGR